MRDDDDNIKTTAFALVRDFLRGEFPITDEDIDERDGFIWIGYNIDIRVDSSALTVTVSSWRGPEPMQYRLYDLDSLPQIRADVWNRIAN